MKNFNVDQVVSSLIKQRKDWEKNAYKKSNEQLYDILTECLVVYEDYLAAENKKQWKEDFVKIASKYGVKTARLNLTRPIVRVVFGDSDMCRKRISTYGKVLRAAAENNVRSANLAKWINENGGVHEISRPKRKPALTAKDKSDFVTKNLPTFGVIKQRQIRNMFGADEKGDLTLLIAEIANDGTVEIRQCVKSETVLTSALKSLYPQIRDEVIEAGEAEIARSTVRNLNSATNAAA